MKYYVKIRFPIFSVHPCCSRIGQNVVHFIDLFDSELSWETLQHLNILTHTPLVLDSRYSCIHGVFPMSSEVKRKIKSQFQSLLRMYVLYTHSQVKLSRQEPCVN